jgi:hypothetical protein
MDHEEKSDLVRLTNFIAGVLAQCRNQGMELPFVVCATSSNGSRFVVHCFQRKPGHQLGCEVVENHMVASGFDLPVNIKIVDETGEATRIEIEQMGPTFH